MKKAIVVAICVLIAIPLLIFTDAGADGEISPIEQRIVSDCIENCDQFLIQWGPLEREEKCSGGRSWADAQANWRSPGTGWCHDPNYIGFGCLININVDLDNDGIYEFTSDPALEYGAVYGEICNLAALEAAHSDAPPW